jgi:hypothetical protein
MQEGGFSSVHDAELAAESLPVNHKILTFFFVEFGRKKKNVIFAHGISISKHHDPTWFLVSFSYVAHFFQGF